MENGIKEIDVTTVEVNGNEVTEIDIKMDNGDEFEVIEIDKVDGEDDDKVNSEVDDDKVNSDVDDDKVDNESDSSECNSSDDVDNENNEKPKMFENMMASFNKFFTTIQSSPNKPENNNDGKNDTDKPQQPLNDNPLSEIFSMVSKLMNDNKTVMSPLFETLTKTATNLNIDSIKNPIKNAKNLEYMTLKLYLNLISKIKNDPVVDDVEELKKSAVKLHGLCMLDNFDDVVDLPETHAEINNFHKYYYKFFIMQLLMKINEMNKKIDDIDNQAVNLTFDDLVVLFAKNK